MLTCGKCKLNKNITDFRKSAGRSNGFAWTCKTCEKIRINDLRARSRIKNQETLVKLKEQGCVYCGDNEIIGLDLHHIDPSIKVCSISDIISQRSSVTKFLKEIAKCEVVCSKCHRKIEAGQKLTRMSETLEQIRKYFLCY